MNPMVLGQLSGLQPVDASTWTLAVIPDTQRLAPNNPTAYNNLMQWVVDNKDTEDIRMVMHIGDYANNGASSSEWSVVDTAVNRLHANNVPFIHCAGNHDYDDDGKGNDYTRPTSTYWETVFPASDWSGYSWYVDEYDGITTNQAATLTIGDKKYLYLTLEIFPRQAVINWANGIITAQSPDRIIVVTHMMVAEEGNLQVFDGDAPDDYNFCDYRQDADCKTGKDIYDDFISQHDNIILVCNGHDVLNSGSELTGHGTPGETAFYKITSTVNGNTINQHLLNFQNDSSSSYADSAVIRLYKFKHEDNSCDVTTFNPVQDFSYTDSENQFSFNYT